MSLQAVLAEVEPGWYATADGDGLDPALLRRAQVSALGERMLARWLAAGPAAALLAPTPQREIGSTALRWPRQRLGPLLRDLGVLSLAPAIRSEVGREAVRVLKQALGNSYLLALDRTVWDGKVPTELLAEMIAQLREAIDAGGGANEALFALLDRRGRAELAAWAQEHDPALGQWTLLLHPRETSLVPVLPAQQAKLLHEHHLARDRAA